MSDFTWPSFTDGAFLPTDMEITQRHNNRASVSPHSGYTQTLSVPGMRWGMTLMLQRQLYSDRQRIEAFLTDLNGMEHRVALYDMGRPVPLGTINLSGVTASAASALATTIVLNGCGNTKTLKVGDWFSVVIAGGIQLLMNMVDATSNAGGVMTVARFKPQLRAAVTGSAAVVTDKPTMLCINVSPQVNLPRTGGLNAAPMALEFVERFTA